MMNNNNPSSESSSNKKKKLVKCFCNDDFLCPPLNGQSNGGRVQQQSDDSSDLLDDKLSKFLKENNYTYNYCKTNKVCMTKKYKKRNGQERYKYYCDHPILDSIRDTIVQYRDCRIDTASDVDRRLINQSSSEFCCDSGNFCNIHLKPNHATMDIFERVDNKVNSDNNNNNNNPIPTTNTNPTNHNNSQTPHPFNADTSDSSSGVITPLNLALITLTSGVFVIALLLLVFYLFKRKSVNKNKNKANASGKNVLKTKPQIYQATPKVPSSSSTSTSSSTGAAHHQPTGGGGQTGGAAPCSPYSTTTSSSSSTANTSITASKENSFNNGSTTTTTDVYVKNAKLKLYNETMVHNMNGAMLNKSDESLEPLLKLTANGTLSTSLANGSTATTDIQLKSKEDLIKLNSPPMSVTQSSGFVCSNSSQTATTNTNTTNTTTSPSEFEWSGSGSGAGLPQCVQRTIARQIKLIYPCIGKGRFGEVYKGEWRGEYVAVKTFNSADEKSWENECNIYNTSGFRHENILGFIAADNIDRGLYTELWLITEFHANGSLYDYLTQNKITPDVAIKMALSIVNGLVHLHMPIESCKGKPALAHCDLKSKNILVKNDLNCCIGDLGLALTGDKDGKLMVHGANIRTGTKRYMAPEILSKRIDTKYLDSFQKAEIYSLALIFWELLRSCKFEDDSTHAAYSFEYKLPYFEYLAIDPDESTMKQIVCDQKLRPGISQLWRQNKIMHELSLLTEELWVENPNERLNALRIKKSITKIKNNLVGVVEPRV